MRGNLVGCLALFVALTGAAVAGGVGTAYGSSHPSAHAAKSSKGGKTNHALNATFRTPAQNVGLPLGVGPNTIEVFDDGALAGRPFGSRKPQVHEDGFLTYNQSDPIGTGDFSGTYHINFLASMFGGPRGEFRGFYDYTVDANGNPSSAITGVITRGSGRFRGASGSFTVLDRVITNNSNSAYTARWKGTIRY